MQSWSTIIRCGTNRINTVCLQVSTCHIHQHFNIDLGHSETGEITVLVLTSLSVMDYVPDGSE